MEREVIFAIDIRIEIFGKRPWASRSEEILADSQPKEDDGNAPDTEEKASTSDTEQQKDDSATTIDKKIADGEAEEVKE